MKHLFFLTLMLSACTLEKSHVVSENYETGELLSSVTYTNEERHGPAQFYWKNGKLWGEGEYAHGRTNGIWKNYYESGTLKSEGTFKAGKKEGIWKSYHPNGQLSWEALYKNDGIVESSPNYDEEGEPIEIMEEGC